MKKCRKCGCENPDDSLFCGDCGEKLNGPPHIPTEMEVLVDLAREKDEEAIEKLVRMTEKKLYYIAYNFLKDKDSAMSVLQDTYEYNFKKLDQLRDNSKFESWLAVSVSNRCRNELKKLNRNNEVNMSSFDDVDENLSFEENIADESMEFRPEENMNYEELKAGLSEVMAELPENQRMSILLVYLQGMKVSEASEALGIPEGTIKSNINYGKKAIKAKIEELRAQNKSFYAVAPIPFLIWMLKEEMDKMESPGIVVHASNIEPVVQKVGTSTVTKAVAKSAGKSMVAKGVLGVVCGVVVGASVVVGGMSLLSNNSEDTFVEDTSVEDGGKSNDVKLMKSENLNIFSDVLAMYQNAITPEDTTAYEKGSINTEDTALLSALKENGGGASWKLGYVFVDLNGDGQSELLIGSNKDKTKFYDLYAYIDNQIILLSEENGYDTESDMKDCSTYSLMDNNKIIHRYNYNGNKVLSIGEFDGEDYLISSKYRYDKSESLCQSLDVTKNEWEDIDVSEFNSFYSEYSGVGKSLSFTLFETEREEVEEKIVAEVEEKKQEKQKSKSEEKKQNKTNSSTVEEDETDEEEEESSYFDSGSFYMTDFDNYRFWFLGMFEYTSEENLLATGGSGGDYRYDYSYYNNTDELSIVCQIYKNGTAGKAAMGKTKTEATSIYTSNDDYQYVVCGEENRYYIVAYSQKNLASKVMEYIFIDNNHPETNYVMDFVCTSTDGEYLSSKHISRIDSINLGLAGTRWGYYMCHDE